MLSISSIYLRECGMSCKRLIFDLFALQKHVEEVVAIAEVKYFIT